MLRSAADRSQAQGEAIAERAETDDQKRENPSALHSCRNVGDLFERADRPDRFKNPVDMMFDELAEQGTVF